MNIKNSLFVEFQSEIRTHHSTGTVPVKATYDISVQSQYFTTEA